LLLQQQANIPDPEYNRKEPRRYQRIGGEIGAIDIQPGAEKISKDDNGQQGKSKNRFHFVVIYRVSTKFFYVFSEALCSFVQEIQQVIRLDPEGKRQHRGQNKRISEEEMIL
jgi:hypothetical protein